MTLGKRLRSGSVAAAVLVSVVRAMADPSVPSPSDAGSAGPHSAPQLWRQEDWLLGLNHRGLKLEDARTVFDAVFARLPAEVRVWPTENYYYWQLASDGRSLQGNLRLPAGGPERGALAIAYGESLEFLDDSERAQRLAVSKTFGPTEGVDIRRPDPLTVEVTCNGRTVSFRLNPLPQEPPTGAQLGPEERFLQRTQDESGLRFHLMYHTIGRHFFWLLDESHPPPETFRPLADDVVIGRRTGFVFWSQPTHGGRKVLASVRRASLQRNDYHDGPFDQLADNFVTGDGLRPFVEESMPWLRGRVDPWGYILGGPAPRRVALTVHGTHDKPAEALALIHAAKLRSDPLGFIARGGHSEPPSPEPPISQPPTSEPAPGR